MAVFFFFVEHFFVLVFSSGALYLVLYTLLNTLPPAEKVIVSTPSMPALVPEDDVLSLAASASRFLDDIEEGTSRASEAGSLSSAWSSGSETG